MVGSGHEDIDAEDIHGQDGINDAESFLFDRGGESFVGLDEVDAALFGDDVPNTHERTLPLIQPLPALGIIWSGFQRDFNRPYFQGDPLWPCAGDPRCSEANIFSQSFYGRNDAATE